MNLKLTNQASFSIGKIVTDSQQIAKQFELKIDDLKKHVLICGGTGSGKTVTCASVLKHLWAHNIPFMLVQPDRLEYRGLLLNDEQFKEKGIIYTVGNETVSPLHINPFQVLPGCSIGKHLEALKSIFDACFEMYAPMPQVLERALSHVYELRGWNLAQNKNYRLPAGALVDDPRFVSDIFPTISDLYNCIEPLTESFGYSERIGPDVIAALKSRIGSLMAANKQHVFNVKQSTCLDELFTKPTIIELQDFFNTSDKAFFLSLLLLQLSEYRTMRPSNRPLQHVLVMEDGQRLLNCNSMATPNKSTGSNFAHLFTDFVCQLGAYGQGVVIVTQTPGQLIPELLSNTGLKIVHRLVTATDLDSVSCSTYLSEAEKRHIAALSTGNAFVYGEDMLHPNHLRIESAVEGMFLESTPKDSNIAVRTYAAEGQKQEVTAKSQEYAREYEGPESAVDPALLDTARIVASDRLFTSAFHRFVLAVQKDAMQLVHLRASLIGEVQRVIGRSLAGASLRPIVWRILVEATDRYFNRKGEIYYWTFDQVQEQKANFLALLKPAFLNAGEKMHIAVINDWREGLVNLQKVDVGPLSGCSACTSKCLYRFEVSEWARDPGVKFDFNSTIQRSDVPASQSAGWFCWLLSERLVGHADVDLSYCLAVHLVREQQLSEDAQNVLLSKIRSFLIEQKSLTEAGDQEPVNPEP